MNGRVLAYVAFALVLSASPASATDDVAEATDDLAEIRAEIADLESKIRQTVEQRGAAESELRAAELAEAEARRELATVREQRQASEKRLQRLEAEATRTRGELASERAELGRQLRLAYVGGQEEWLRLVLSQRDPVAASRQLVYYGYLTRQRSNVVAGVREQLLQLEENALEVAAERERLAGIETSRRARLDEITAAREARSIALARVEKQVAQNEGRVVRLQAQAEQLETLVAELTKLLAGSFAGESEPFAQMKGQLSWPADGTLIGDFGKPRGDARLRWDGVLLTTDPGSEVRSVHHGRVVFADWLPGMGLLLIVEHGDGYISLYGHNRDLLKDVGDWVGPGEPIAHAGDSGGQRMAGVYFEIRKDGRPVDPHAWISD